MAIVVKEIDGRRWSDTTTGGSVKRSFIITGLAVGFTPSWSYTGLPNVGDVHPSLSNYYCTSRDFEEGQGSEKIRVKVTCNYEKKIEESSGSGSTAVTSQVEEIGWDAETEERELVDAADGTAVLNSAGDVFERVPTVSVPAPTFTKVMKFKQLQSGAMDCDCKVNSSAVTIGGRTYPIGSLLCHVAWKRIIGDADWKYRYTIQLKYRTNPVKLAGASTVTDIGWDVAITDAGMRELDDNGKLKLIKSLDSETGKRCTVTTPELLDGEGKAVTRSSESTPTPYNIRFQAYERVTIPAWFYSEPS